MRAPGRAPEGTTNRITSRRVALIAGVAVASLLASTATPSIARPITAAPTTTLAVGPPAPLLLDQAFATTPAAVAEYERLTHVTRAHRATPRPGRRATTRTPTKRAGIHRGVPRHRAAPAHQRTRTRQAPGGGYAAVIAFAYAHLGDQYRKNATGPRTWDCSGFTQAAYRRAGIRLPHRSTEQAARGRRVSRAHALPGDLVVGDLHVGIYLGDGWMIDAGNPRVDVSKRRMYGGLWIVTFRH